MELQKQVEKAMELMPCRIGGEAWAFKVGTKVPARKGVIREMRFANDGKLYVVVHGIGQGALGERVFLTQEDADSAWRRKYIREEEKIMVNHERIKELIAEKGIEQKALAEEVGVSATMIGYIVKGLKEPSVAVLARIARQLGVPVGELIIEE